MAHARPPATASSGWFVRLSANVRYDAWLIGWHAHQGVDLHDHGGSAGALYVVEGELLETSGRLDVEGRAATKRRSPPAPPSPSVEDHVHWVVNPTPRVTTSIHVYSPPLTTMDFYETESDSTFHRLRTELADHRPDQRHR